MRPRVGYFESKEEEDPFPDESFLDPVDAAQHNEIILEIESMISRAEDAGLRVTLIKLLREIVAKNTDVFHVGLPSRPTAKFKPLKIELQPDAKPVWVCLWNYTQ